MGLILFFTAAIHLFFTPFTKVEESFNVQAMHDILYLRHNFSQYDHLEFPGVVPRTFLGPLVVSIISSPAVIFFQYVDIKKFWSQYVVRLVLAALVTAAWDDLRKVIEKKFGFMVSTWYTLVTISQFHFMFYMSRPLPNIMATPLVLYAIAFWLKEKSSVYIWLSGAAIVVFRAELVILLGLFLVNDIYMKKISIEEFLKIAVPAGITLLSATVIVDSFFWGRPLWPEGEVLWYNTILNKSSNWGVSPFMWYFYSAIPRAMGTSIFFLPIGLYLEPRSRSLGVAAITFIFLYSILPHKELRFIIYVFPLLNLSVACACHRMWINKTKSIWQAGLALVAGGHLLINATFTLFLLIVSSTNYPGGVALSRLHRTAAHEKNVSVHICDLAAQSGVSRFMQVRPDWNYNKREDINYTDDELNQFTHLLVEAKNKFSGDWPLLTQNFEALEYVDCFNNIGIQYNTFVPIKVKTKPCIGIMKRRPHIIPPNKIDTGVFDVNKKLKEHKPKDEIPYEDVKIDVYQDSSKQGKSTEIPIDYSETYENERKEDKLPYSYKPMEDPEKREKQYNKEYVAEDEEDEQAEDVGQSAMWDDNTENEEQIDIIDDDAEVDEIQVKYPDESEQITSTEKAENIIPSTFRIQVLEDDDSEVTISTEYSEEYEAEHFSSNQQKSKEINFQELKNLALGRATKSAKDKLREIIEHHYRSKGSIIESAEADSIKKTVKLDEVEVDKRSAKISIKNIIKQEKIREMVERISKMNLIDICELEKMTTKECLKKVIDEIDENEKI